MRTPTHIPITKRRAFTTCRRRCRRCTAARRCSTCISMRTRSSWPRTCPPTAPRPESCPLTHRCATITRHGTTHSPTTPHPKVPRPTASPPPPSSHTHLYRDTRGTNIINAVIRFVTFEYIHQAHLK